MTRPWDVLVVGGGPAAALQIRSARPGERVAVVTPAIGGGMAMLGGQRMQSYLDELRIDDGRSPLAPYTDAWAMSPTGHEYARYVADVIRASGVPVLPLTVADVCPDGGRPLTVVARDRLATEVALRAHTVVLATGCRPRPAPFGTAVPGALSHDEVYGDLTASRLERYRDRAVVIVGGGNTALQLAGRLATTSRDVTILATRYRGIFPQETDDRFAWRAPSQLTCEMVAKTALRSLTDAAPGLAVRFIVYDDFTVTPGGAIEFTYDLAANAHPLGRYAWPPFHPALARVRTALGRDRWRERRDLRDTVLVSAVGITPAYPGGPSLRRLKRDASGAILHAGGQTEWPGLCLAGACAGFPAVNYMLPAAIVPTGAEPTPAVGVAG